MSVPRRYLNYYEHIQNMVKIDDINRGIEIYRNKGLYRFLKSVCDWLEYHPPFFEQRLRFRTWLARHRDPSVANPFKILYVDPMKIDRASRFNSRKCAGRILGGNWDLNAHQFEDRTVFIGLSQRFIEGRDWSDTVYYENALKKLEKNDHAYGCWSPDKIISVHCEYLDELYNRIKNEGYKSQSEIATANRATHRNTQSGSDLVFHEVTVSIGRNGEFLFDSGNHRLSIAKILELNKIPVQVVVRHKQWQEIRQKVQRDKKTKIELDHPDLDDVR